MIAVIQIYKSKEFFDKSLYTPDNRKLFSNIRERVESTNGYLDDTTLYLPTEYRNHPDITSADLIVIQDTEGFNPFLMNKYLESRDCPDWFISSRRKFQMENNHSVLGLRHLDSPKAFEIFKIGKSKPDAFDMYIDYVPNSMTIGIPERENHKICELRKNRPVRYKVNGKSDFTMTGRKQRSYHEFDYLIEWIGQADKLAFLEPNRIKQTKKIPITTDKVIDERKILK
jgi:hypothetical protein